MQKNAPSRGVLLIFENIPIFTLKIILFIEPVKNHQHTRKSSASICMRKWKDNANGP